MNKSQINASFLSMPLDWDKYEKINWSIKRENIEQLVKNTTEGLISTSKDENGNFPFQAVKKK